MKAIILYASITGNAKGMARIEQQFFEHYGWDVTLGEMIQTDPATIKDFDVLVLATYTWTGGVIPEETQDFYDDLVENFRLIEQALNNFNSEINSLNGQFNELNKDEIQTELINDAGITVTDNDGETSDIDISDTGSSEIS